MYFDKRMAALFLMRGLKIIFVISIIIFAANSLFAEAYNVDMYFKDDVSNKGQSLVVAVNRDTNQIELYWSGANQTWLRPTKEEQLGLQKLYNRKNQLLEMQKDLILMRKNTWYSTDEGPELTNYQQ